MRFRKHSLLYCQNKIVFIITLGVGLLMIPVVGIVISLLCWLPSAIFIVLNPFWHNEYIVIDENGIVCQQSGKQIWGYAWNEIAELRRSKRFRLPAIEVITYDKWGKPEEYALSNEYFQLCKAAKDALGKYYVDNAK